MTEKHSDHTSDEATADITSAFRADFSEPDTPATARAQGAVSGIDELPSGSALLVVKRGPNAGSLFVLDQPVTSAGRHPKSDIFCDDITVSRRHAEFRRQNSEFQVVDVGSLNGTYVNREPVQSAVLSNGDEIQIGKFRLVFLTLAQTMTGSRLGRRGLEVDGVEVVTDYHHLSGYGDRSGGPRRVLPSTEVAGWRVVMGKGDRRKSRRCGPLYKYGRPGRDIAPTSRA